MTTIQGPATPGNHVLVAGPSHGVYVSEGMLLPLPPPVPLRVRRLYPDAKLPVYATDGAACMDLFMHRWVEPCESFPFGVIGTGLAFAVPDGWALEVYSRSGHGIKHAVRLLNAVGIGDADYRGELMVGLTCDYNGKNPRYPHAREIEVSRGDRIAQFKLAPAPRIQLIEVDELPSTARGAGGFGSTGSGEVR